MKKRTRFTDTYITEERAWECHNLILLLNCLKYLPLDRTVEKYNIAKVIMKLYKDSNLNYDFLFTVYNLNPAYLGEKRNLR